MRTLLLVIAFTTMFVQSNLAFAQTKEATYKTELFVPAEILCSPDKDTMFVVKGPTTDVILEVWDMPVNADEKPVFIFVSREVIQQMALMPRYARKQ